MCQQCGSDTRRSGLREVDGLCISCWREKAARVDALLAEIDYVKRLYGNNLKVAPDSILRIFDAADRAKGGALK